MVSWAKGISSAWRRSDLFWQGCGSNEGARSNDGYIFSRAYIHACIHTYMKIYLHTCRHIHIYTYIHTYMHIHTHTPAYMHIYLHAHILTCLYDYIHTVLLTYRLVLRDFVVGKMQKEGQAAERGWLRNLRNPHPCQEWPQFILNLAASSSLLASPAAQAKVGLLETGSLSHMLDLCEDVNFELPFGRACHWPS